MKITYKILVVILVFAVVVVGVAFYFSEQNSEELIKSEVDEHTRIIESRFRNDVSAVTISLTTGLDVLAGDRNLKDAYLSGDRERLQSAALPLFERIKEQSEITHFYFIRPDRTCFLRVHDPATFDDQISRPSLLQAVESGVVGSGLELGKNVFAIRVVKPYYDGDRLIGYVEFSKEIGSFLEILKQETGHDFALYGAKDFMSREDWSKIRSKRGQPDNWDELSGVVEIAKTDSGSADNACFGGLKLGRLLEDPQKSIHYSVDGKQLACSALAISDRQGNKIATLAILHDMTEVKAIGQKTFRNEAWIVAGIVVGLMLLLLVLITRLIIRPISLILTGMSQIASGRGRARIDFRSNDELGGLVRGFNDMAEELYELNDQLANRARILKSKLDEISSKNDELDLGKRELAKTLQSVAAEKQRCDFMAHDLEKFKLAVDNASDFVIITDPEGKVLYANRSAQMLSGCSLNELASGSGGPRCLWGGLMDDEYFRRLWQTVKVERKAFISEVRNVSKTGREYQAAVSVSPVLEEDGTVRFIVGIGRDVTREWEVEKAKSTFVSLVSHQLRTPLTSIKWIIEILLSQAPGKLNQKQTEFMVAANESAARLVMLINDLLNINHLDAGSLFVKIAPTDYLALVKDVLKELEPQFKRKRLKLKKDWPKKMPKAEFDQLLVRQAITNVLANAIKYTPDKGTVSVTLALEGGNIRTMITDTGMGIPEGEQPRIFERFFRASNVQAQFNDGTGLGLSLVKSIVEIMGGQVGFTSKLGAGTSVWFVLPLVSDKHKNQSDEK